MSNEIGINVSGKNNMPATFDEIKAQASVFGAGSGADAGNRFSSTFADEINDAIPPAFKDQVAPKIQDQVKDSGRSSGSAFSSAFSGELSSGLSSTGVIGGSLGDAIGKEGGPSGEKFASTFSQSAKNSLLQSTISGAMDPGGEVGTRLTDDAEKTGSQVGKSVGESASSSMSPLIVGALAGVAAVGAPVLLAGLGTAFVGIAAIALKSNATIAADYQKLGKDAESAITQAAAPLAGSMNQAVGTLDSEVKKLQPDLDNLFAGVEPDIQNVAQGISNFASQAVPGLSQAVGSSQVIVKDFSNSLGPLGSGVGSFFTGLTKDAATTGAGLQSVVGVAGNALSTLGTVAGSASAAISTDLLAVDPAINGLLTGIKAIANPATVGALAGVFGAMKFDPAISSGLTSMSKSLGGFAKDAESTSGLMGTIKGAAGGMSGALGTAAGVMNGPWGMAIGAGVGLLSGLVGSLINASHASDALTVSQQGLAQSIAQDGGTVGSATTAYIAQQDAANGLSASASKAGVSLATYTQAVIGNKQAQQDVIAAVNKANQAQDNAAVSAETAGASTGKFSDEQKDAATTSLASAASSNKLTDANAQLLNSMKAQQDQIAAQITKQAQLTQATNTLNNSETVFNATMKANYQLMVQSSQQAAMNTVSALNLGDGSYKLNQQIYQSVDAYNQAKNQGNAYLQVLDSMSGETNSLIGAEASFTESIGSLTSSVQTNGKSLDVNTQSGAKNLQTITQLATAADNAAGAVYTSEVNTKGASKAYDDASAKLEQEKQAFIDNAEKAGLNAGQVQDLADELFKLPSSKNIPISADTSQAESNVQALINRIDNSYATVIVGANTALEYSLSHKATGGIVGAAASGGIRSGRVLVGENGREIVDMPVGSTVHSNSDTERMLSQGPSGGSSGPLQVEWIGGSGADELFNLLRKNIRFRYGKDTNSVQKALGQSF